MMIIDKVESFSKNHLIIDIINKYLNNNFFSIINQNLQHLLEE
jgi:hypothetical protein